MAKTKFVNTYTRLDRILHRVAFSSGAIQESLSDVEDQLFKNKLAEYEISRPVFITGLPRAGTTILLNLVHQTGEFVSHTYRSMPFVLCPVFWQRFSNNIRSNEHHEMERAHGDGITISVDSPEAFEEIIWRRFWKAHYREDRIDPWGKVKYPDFVNFLTSHCRKLLMLSASASGTRYLSKNNLNIARLRYIGTVFPDASFLVPFRTPVQHASSLLNQHLKFLQTHKEDKFASAYMRGIGHYDFGENFLPVNFDDWLQGDRRAEATDLTFWLEYWVAAYRNIVSNITSSIYLVPFEQLVQSPEAVLQKIAAALDLQHPSKLISQHPALQKAPDHPIDEACLPEKLLNEASALYDTLNSHSIGAK